MRTHHQVSARLAQQRIFKVDRLHDAAVDFAGDGGPRQEGDAETGGDETAQHFDRMSFEQRRQCHAGVGGDAGNDLGDAVTFAEHGAGRGQTVRQFQTGAAGEGMPDRSNDAKRLAGDCQRPDARVRQRCVGDADIRVAVGDGIDHVLGAAEFDDIADI